MSTKEEIKQIVESLLREKIKFIGENDQTYIGCPSELINELTYALCEAMNK